MRKFFLCFIFASSFIPIVQASSFKEKQIDPFLSRVTDETSLQLLAAGTISVFLVKPSDDSIRNQWVDHQKMSANDSKAGDVIGSGVASAVILGGQYFFDVDENNYQSHARALVYSTVMTTAMKYSFGRQRPGNSDSHQSFPSGHTSVSFASATSLTYAYGWKAAMVAYPVAMFVGLSRLSDDAHWASDVVGGAFVGFIMARASSYVWDDSSGMAHSKTNLVFYPDFRPNGMGFGISYKY